MAKEFNVVLSTISQRCSLETLALVSEYF